jgi:hypothetical protein
MPEQDGSRRYLQTWAVPVVDVVEVNMARPAWTTVRSGLREVPNLTAVWMPL